ncbi:hypothetical protein GGS23DRAFT_599397 [Durotheca rogersii]|uniref:uncharacterized protein n=1 Tax=Durotheca rogersii TaxID=419775 RepID=UPI00221FED14|nr:uncharacterized protein GGS23DRAFT_599397 [Durotheca rogersii]KAI5860589.1 hypothetical protein GGS23DRAFT_599397 [Durotheca rogersii]
MSLNTLDLQALAATARTAATTLRQNRPASLTAAAAVGAAVAIPLLWRLVADYRAWYALGPNGLSSNPGGYLFQVLLTPLARADTCVPAPYDPVALARSPPYGPLSRRSFFAAGAVPPRARARPDIPRFVAPHRQTSQRGSAATRARQNDFLRALAAANPALLCVRPSRLEGPLFDALWVTTTPTPATEEGEGKGGEGPPQHRAELRRLSGEFAHVHGEGSTHLVLSPADAAAAIAAGWGERHPMSGVSIRRGRSMLPWGYIMIYAPREGDDDEMRIWREFVVASARYIFAGEQEIVIP